MIRRIYVVSASRSEFLAWKRNNPESTKKWDVQQIKSHEDLWGQPHCMPFVCLPTLPRAEDMIRLLILLRDMKCYEAMFTDDFQSYSLGRDVGDIVEEYAVDKSPFMEFES